MEEAQFLCEIYFDFLFPEILLLLLTIKKSYTYVFICRWKQDIQI